MKKYVTGFCFNMEMTQVVLIKKNQPDWQKGLYNGVGGKIEPDEESSAAMQREFLEEAGLNISNWDYYVTIGDDKWFVDFYWTQIENIDQVKTMTAEEIHVVNLEQIFDGTIPVINNLFWLLPMCIDQVDCNYNIYIKQ